MIKWGESCGGCWGGQSWSVRSLAELGLFGWEEREAGWGSAACNREGVGRMEPGKTGILLL